MTRRLMTLFSLCSLAIVATVGLRAQTVPATSSSDAVTVLVAEVRALRAEVSTAASASLRSQLLVARVQLQEQRLMHLDRERSEVASKRADAEKMRVMFAGQVKQLQTQSTDAGDAKEREAAKFVIESLRNQLQAAQANEAALRAQEDTLLNSISAEQSRWSDFNSRLDELERSLPKASGR